MMRASNFLMLQTDKTFMAFKKYQVSDSHSSYWTLFTDMHTAGRLFDSQTHSAYTLLRPLKYIACWQSPTFPPHYVPTSFTSSTVQTDTSHSPLFGPRPLWWFLTYILLSPPLTRYLQLPLKKHMLVTNTLSSDMGKGVSFYMVIIILPMVKNSSGFWQ